jgi:hypothetical protein
MSKTTTIHPEFRSAVQIRADEDIADLSERYMVVDAKTGLSILAATDGRRLLAEVLAVELNNAIAPGGLNSPFLWNGRPYKIVRAAFAGGVAEVETVPSDAELQSELRRRIEAAPHHVLTFYQGFGFICFAEDHARYKDFTTCHG